MISIDFKRTRARFQQVLDPHIKASAQFNSRAPLICTTDPSDKVGTVYLSNLTITNKGKNQVDLHVHSK